MSYHPDHVKTEALRLYHETRRPLQEIADELGISVSSISVWVAKAGASKRGHDHRRRANPKDVVALHTQDRLTLTEVARRVGVSRERVRQIVRKAGVPESFSRDVLRERQALRWVPWRCEACGREERLSPYQAAHRKRCDQCRRNPIPDQELIAELLRLAQQLNRTPRQADIRDYGRYSAGPYYRRWGSLRIAQRAAGLSPNPVGRPRRAR